MGLVCPRQQGDSTLAWSISNLLKTEIIDAKLKLICAENKDSSTTHNQFAFLQIMVQISPSSTVDQTMDQRCIGLRTPQTAAPTTGPRRMVKNMLPERIHVESSNKRTIS